MKRADLIGLVAFWLAAITAIGVHGPFPLFDDWVYSRQVAQLLAGGPMAAAPSSENLLLPQLVWGALFSWPTGFSFAALRVSTLVAAAIATVLCYLLVQSIGADRRAALCGALVVAANPLFVSLAFTFMSDVPTIALIVAALYAFALAERDDSVHWFTIAIVLATAATLNRLTAATIVAGLAVGHVLAAPSRARLLRATVGALSAFAALRLAEAAFAATVGLPGSYGARGEIVVERLSSIWRPDVAVQVAWAFARAAMVLGWFALPLFVFTRVRLSRWTIAGGLTLAAVVVAMNKPLPLMGNMLYERGLGPLMVPGIEGRGPLWAWWILTAAACGGAAFLAEITLRSVRMLWQERHGTSAGVTRALSGAALIGVWGPVLAHAPVNLFDRYLVAALPPLVLLTVIEWQPRARAGARPHCVTALAIICAMGLFAVLATRDQLHWQRARWQVIRAVVTQGVPAVALDGGYEYNGEVRNIGFAPAGPPITHHVALVGQIPADALLCVPYDALIGPKAVAICVRPGLGDRSRPRP